MEDEIEKRARDYAGREFRERRTIKVQALYWCSDEDVPLTRFLNEIEYAVPDEFKDTARVVFERGRYDEGDRFFIEYDRPETDDEVNDRISRAIRYAKEAIDLELAQYKRLKAKFE